MDSRTERVVLETDRHRIVGDLTLPKEGHRSRLSDFLNRGDLDFLVEFAAPSSAAYADNFFGFKEALERLFGRPVDLVVASAIKNPYFRESVERAKRSVYAA